MIQRAAGKHRPLIRSYRRRIAPKQCNAVQNTHNLNAWNSECGDNCQALLRDIFHAGSALDPATTSQCVHDEIH